MCYTHIYRAVLKYFHVFVTFEFTILFKNQVYLLQEQVIIFKHLHITDHNFIGKTTSTTSNSTIYPSY